MDYLNEVEKELDLSPKDRKRVMDEVRVRYDTIRGELADSGMSKIEAAREAAEKMGRPDIVASGLMAEPHAGSWRTAALAAFPYFSLVFIALIYVMAQAMIPSVAVGLKWVCCLGLSLTLIIGSGLSLRKDHRPDWLATWLPMAIQLPGALLLIYFRHTSVDHISWLNNPAFYVCMAVVFSTIQVIQPRLSIRRTAILVSMAALVLLAFLLLRGQSWNMIFIMGFIYVSSIRLYAGHNNGNICQTALFLYSIMSIPPVLDHFFSIPNIHEQVNTYQYHLHIASTVICSTVMGTAAVMYVRTPTKRSKLAALCLGILMWFEIPMFWHALSEAQAVTYSDTVRNFLNALCFIIPIMIPVILFDSMSPGGKLRQVADKLKALTMKHQKPVRIIATMLVLSLVTSVIVGYRYTISMTPTYGQIRRTVADHKQGRNYQVGSSLVARLEGSGIAFRPSRLRDTYQSYVILHYLMTEFLDSLDPGDIEFARRNEGKVPLRLLNDIQQKSLLRIMWYVGFETGNLQQPYVQLSRSCGMISLCIRLSPDRTCSMGLGPIDSKPSEWTYEDQRDVVGEICRGVPEPTIPQD